MHNPEPDPQPEAEGATGAVADALGRIFAAGGVEPGAVGRLRRADVPRREHAHWFRPSWLDPLAIVEASNAGAPPELIPIRRGRMAASVFAWFRGTPQVMAADLFATPTTGIDVVAVGDAHLANFGAFTPPDGRRVLDVDDFDEAMPGPWEWDVKRLAASCVVAAIDHHRPASVGEEAATAAVASYRTHLRALVRRTPIELWSRGTDVAPPDTHAEVGPGARPAVRPSVVSTAATGLAALARLTRVVDGRRVIVDDPPVLVHEGLADRADLALAAFADHLERAPVEQRALLDHYRVADAARMVVGVARVGLRCAMVLLEATSDRSPVLLQVREARPSALAPHVGDPGFAGPGERVVAAQRFLQAAPDPFLGWGEAGGVEFSVRQLWSRIGRVPLETLSDEGFAAYSQRCGRVLARAHARSAGAVDVAAYLGRGSGFDRAVARFATTYAQQVVRDHAVLVAAIERGHLVAVDR